MSTINVTLSAHERAILDRQPIDYIQQVLRERQHQAALLSRSALRLSQRGYAEAAVRESDLAVRIMNKCEAVQAYLKEREIARIGKIIALYVRPAKVVA